MYGKYHVICNGFIVLMGHRLWCYQLNWSLSSIIMSTTYSCHLNFDVILQSILPLFLSIFWKFINIATRLNGRKLFAVGGGCENPTTFPTAICKHEDLSSHHSMDSIHLFSCVSWPYLYKPWTNDGLTVQAASFLSRCTLQWIIKTCQLYFCQETWEAYFHLLSKIANCALLGRWLDALSEVYLREANCLLKHQFSPTISGTCGVFAMSIENNPVRYKVWEKKLRNEIDSG